MTVETTVPPSLATDRRRDRAALNIGSQIVGAIQQLIFARHRFRLQLEIKNALIPNLPRREILSEETHRETVVPLRIDAFLDTDRFVAIFFNLHVARSVISERNGNWRITYRFSIN